MDPQRGLWFFASFFLNQHLSFTSIRPQPHPRVSTPETHQQGADGSYFGTT